MVKIITDSGALFESGVTAEDIGVEVVPLRIKVGDKTYREGVDIDAPALLEMMQAGQIPEVLPPTREELERIYGRVIRKAEAILGIYSSGRLVPVTSVAREASIPFLGQTRIAILDSETISLGLGFLVREAAILASEGLPLDEIERRIRGMLPYVYVVSFVQNLEYLRRNRIISASQAILGTMLGIKVFLTIENGRFIPLEKVQTEEEMADKFFEFAAEFLSIEKIAILKSDFDEATGLFLDKVNSLSKDLRVQVLPYNPSFLSFLGPRALSLVVYEGGV